MGAIDHLWDVLHAFIHHFLQADGQFGGFDQFLGIFTQAIIDLIHTLHHFIDGGIDGRQAILRFFG